MLFTTTILNIYDGCFCIVCVYHKHTHLYRLYIKLCIRFVFLSLFFMYNNFWEMLKINLINIFPERSIVEMDREHAYTAHRMSLTFYWSSKEHNVEWNLLQFRMKHDIIGKTQLIYGSWRWKQNLLRKSQ